MAADKISEIGGAEAGAGPSRLWWWVGVLFAVQLAAWVAWFVIAAHHPVEEIPLVQRS